MKAWRIALGILLGATAVYGQPVDHEKLRDAGLAEYRMGRFAQAETLLRDALKHAEASNADRDAALDLSALGDIYNSVGRVSEAGQAYRKALSIFSRLPNGTLLEAITLRNLASVYSAEERYPEALAALRKVSALTAKNKIGGDVLAAQILNTFGVIYLRQGKIKQAETSLKQATQIRMAQGTRLNLDLVQSLNNLGVVYLRRSNYQSAEDSYQKALNITEELSGPSHPDLARILVNLGFLYIKTRRYGDAENQLRRGLAILEQTTPLLVVPLVHTLHGLGKTYMERGDKTAAADFLVRAVDIARRNPGRDSEVLTVFDTYHDLLKRMGDSETAKQVSAEAKRARAVMALTISAVKSNEF